MSVSTFVQPDFTSQSATVYKTSIDDGIAVHHQMAGPFAPHEQAVPDLTVRLDAANFSDLITRTTVTKAAQNTAAFTAPTVDPRNDIIYVDRITGDVGVDAGSEAVSPIDPIITLGKLPIARVRLTVGMTEIANADIDDIRVLGGLGSPLFVNADGGLTLTDVDAGAGAGPLSILDRDSASPAVSDFIGAKIFRGRSSTDAEVDYVELAAQIILATNGSEDARAIIRAMVGGTPTDIITMGPGAQIGTPTGGDKGAGTINAENGIYNAGVLIGGSPNGYINGLILSNNSGDPAKDIDIAAGIARDDGNAIDMVLFSSLIKQLDASWAVGTNAGALDGTESVGGTPDASTWYHIWEIRRSDTGVVDVLASESATAPTMPTNYDQKRRIGAVLFDATPNIRLFHQWGDEFYWETQIEDLNDTTPSTSATLFTVSTPLGIETLAIVSIILTDNAQVSILVNSPDDADVVPSLGNATLSGGVANVNSGSSVEARRKTNTSSQLRYRSSTTSANVFVIMAIGWKDPRGRNG